jgi:4'-phosphopantetheinyl transferase
MIQIYVCQIERLEEELFNQLLSFLSKERQERILRFRHYEDRLRSMIGSLLMHMQVAKQLQCEPMKLKYRVNKFGKCELENNEIHFNISHAGQYAFCAISDRQVGIDIEHILFRDFSIFQSVWTEREKLLFQVNNMEDFYYLWTAKESYMKWLGTGLATDLQTVSIERNGIVYQNDKKAEVRVQHIRVHPQYICAVCSEYCAKQVKYITMNHLKTFYMGENWSNEKNSSC